MKYGKTIVTTALLGISTLAYSLNAPNKPDDYLSKDFVYNSNNNISVIDPPKKSSLDQPPQREEYTSEKDLPIKDKKIDTPKENKKIRNKRETRKRRASHRNWSFGIALEPSEEYGQDTRGMKIRFELRYSPSEKAEKDSTHYKSNELKPNSNKPKVSDLESGLTVPEPTVPNSGNSIEKLVEPSTTNIGSIEYLKLTNRPKHKLGQHTLDSSFYIDKGFWQNLPDGLSKKDFYERLIKAPFKNSLTTVFPGITGIRGTINSQDIINQFMESSDIFIRNSGEYELSTAEFTRKDKEILRGLFDSALVSPVIGTNGFFVTKEVYEFPPGTTINLVKGPEKTGGSFIDIKVPNHPANERIILNDNGKRETIFKKMLEFSLLTEDPCDRGFVPITHLYNLYQGRPDPVDSSWFNNKNIRDTLRWEMPNSRENPTKLSSLPSNNFITI